MIVRINNFRERNQQIYDWLSEGQARPKQRRLDKLAKQKGDAEAQPSPPSSATLDLLTIYIDQSIAMVIHKNIGTTSKKVHGHTDLSWNPNIILIT